MEWPLAVLAAAAVAVVVWFVYTARDSSSDSTARQFADTGYSTWSWRNGRWQMTEDRSQPGYVPGSAPAGTGYEAEVRRVASVRGGAAR